MQNIILIKDIHGNIKQASGISDISRKDINKKITEYRIELQRWEAALADYDQLAGTDTAADDEDDGRVRFTKDETGKIITAPTF